MQDLAAEALDQRKRRKALHDKELGVLVSYQEPHTADGPNPARLVFAGESSFKGFLGGAGFVHYSFCACGRRAYGITLHMRPQNCSFLSDGRNPTAVQPWESIEHCLLAFTRGIIFPGLLCGGAKWILQPSPACLPLKIISPKGTPKRANAAEVETHREPPMATWVQKDKNLL